MGSEPWRLKGVGREVLVVRIWGKTATGRHCSEIADVGLHTNKQARQCAERSSLAPCARISLDTLRLALRAATKKNAARNEQRCTEP